MAYLEKLKDHPAGTDSEELLAIDDESGPWLAETQRSLDFLQSEAPDLPERQRSIRAVFEASWQRLSPEEQSAFT